MDRIDPAAPCDSIRNEMPRPRKPTPTDGELKVLRVMWELGPATLRDIRDALLADERPSPSALATTITAMLGKQLIHVVDERRPQKFAAIATRERTYASIVNDVRTRVFGGSLRDLVKHALGGRKQSAAEIAALRSLLDEMNDDEPKR